MDNENEILEKEDSAETVILENEDSVETVILDEEQELTDALAQDSIDTVLLENDDSVETASLEAEMESIEDFDEESFAADLIYPSENKKSGTVKIILLTVLSTIVALALLAGMTYLVLKGAGILVDKKDVPEKVASETTPEHSYTFGDATVVTMGNNVVAKSGNMQMTNSLLQLYYESTIISYQNQFGMYQYMMGVDFSQPLDTQIYDEATGQTWQDLVLDSSMQSWHAYAAVKQYADAQGFTPDEEGVAYLNGIDAKIQEMVTAYGYTSAEQMVKEQIAPGATVEDLRTYMEMDFYYAVYIEHLQELYAMTDEEAIQYYTENQEVLNQNNISKENGDVVDVRHVLIQLDNSETDEMNQVIYSEEQWEACRVKAQELYDSWLAGEANEETFAQLAKDNSKDGNAAEGGIYTDVPKGAMVETFDAWIFDESRVAGDSGLVKTPYGYHIMFFVNRKAKWIDDTRNYAISEKINKIIEDAMAAYPLETYMDQVGVSH